MSWSARQYSTFEDERTRPVHDLIAAIPALPVRRAVDVGCGPGNSTEVLAARFPDATIAAFDSSEDMIDAARRRLPGVVCSVGDVTSWHDAGPFDVILANAVLQWIPDHASLLPRLLGKLRPGGALAVQMPDNLQTPAHSLMRELAAAGPWSAKLTEAVAARTAIAAPVWYYDLLQAGCVRVDLWYTVYHHVLRGGATAIVDWFKGSGLRPFLAPLNAVEREHYLERYTAAIAEHYPTRADGTVLLPFPRLFFVALRA